MHVPGGGKLPELCDSHVLDTVAVEGGVVSGSQHELQVVHYDMLDVIHVHCMSHRLVTQRRPLSTQQEQVVREWRSPRGLRRFLRLHRSP